MSFSYVQTLEELESWGGRAGLNRWDKKHFNKTKILPTDAASQKVMFVKASQCISWCFNLI